MHGVMLKILGQVGQIAQALAMDKEAFRSAYGRDKPEKDMIFYCKSGVRSETATQLALSMGLKGYDR